MEIKITLARDSHVHEMVEVWKVFMDYHKDIDPHFSRRKDGHVNFEKHLRELMNSNDALVLVALDKGHVVGYSVAEIGKYPPVFESDVYGSISDMAVQPNYRRRGIGEKMLTKLLDWLASRDIDRIEINVIAKNQIGYSFWKKHGFQDYMHALYLKMR